MTLMEQAIALLYILLAAMLSGLIGLERERRNKSAGLRTHILVGVGACLFTVLSYEAFPDGDPTRIASNVVTGVGFLGAGIIVKDRDKGEVHDLTTAASIWATAALGMTIGTGAWLLAFGVTAILWLILAVLRLLPMRHENKEYLTPIERALTSDEPEEA